MLFLVVATKAYAAGSGGQPAKDKECPVTSSKLSEFFNGVKSWTEVLPGTNKRNPKNTFKANINFGNPTASTILWGDKTIALSKVVFTGSKCEKLKIVSSMGSASMNKPRGVISFFGYPLKPSHQVQSAPVQDITPEVLQPETTTFAMVF